MSEQLFYTLQRSEFPAFSCDRVLTANAQLIEMNFSGSDVISNAHAENLEKYIHILQCKDQIFENKI